MSEYGKGGHDALPWIQGRTAANLAGRLQSNRRKGVLSAEHGLSSHGGGSPCHFCSFTSTVTLNTSPMVGLAFLVPVRLLTAEACLVDLERKGILPKGK